MLNTNLMVLIYQDSEGQRYSQNWEDLTESGTLVDPETGDDMELIGWYSPQIYELQAAEQAAWHAGLDEGREQGRRNRLAEAATRKRELDSAGSFHFSDRCHCGTCTCDPNMTPAVRFDLSPAQQEGAVREHLIRLGWTPPKRRPYNASGSLSEYGVFPECDREPTT